ncbi:MAG TPA: Na+/H+ antiporter NhaA [Jiangellaceae bacterium]
MSIPYRSDDEDADREGIWRTGPVWLLSERRLARTIGRPIASFLRVEAAGGIILLVAALIALFWANSAWSETYEQFWGTEITIGVANWELTDDLRHWVNDALMTIFFLVVGLEIKYEMVRGELRDPRRAAVPIAAAIGGMAVPAAIYWVFNPSGAAAAGWGIPMATDIAFALGVIAVLGRRLPSSARIFMLTLAIVDDLGAITVIAVFYTERVSLMWLGVAAVGIVAVVVLQRSHVWSLAVYVTIGAVVWLAVYQSGVHATVAGVILGVLAPAWPLLDQDQARAYIQRNKPERMSAEYVRRARFLLGETVSVAERLEKYLHPWSAYVVLPIFALANAGIYLRGGVLGEAATAQVTIGIVAGLVVGKTVGITLAAWLAVALGLGRKPDGLSWPAIIGLAMVAGIGFTVSLFIADLAFPAGELLLAEAKVGILGGSVIAAVLGVVILLATCRAPAAAADTDDQVGDRPGRSATG